MPCHLFSDTFKGWMPLPIVYIITSASINTLGIQTTGLSHVPFPRNSNHSISVSARKFYLLATPPNKLTPFWFLWEKIEMSFLKVRWNAAVKPSASTESQLLPVPRTPCPWLTRACIHVPGLCKGWRTGHPGHARLMLAWSDSQVACRLFL